MTTKTKKQVSNGDRHVAAYAFDKGNNLFIDVYQNRHGYYLSYSGTKLRSPRLTSLAAVETLLNDMRGILLKK